MAQLVRVSDDTYRKLKTLKSSNEFYGTVVEKLVDNYLMEKTTSNSIIDFVELQKLIKDQASRVIEVNRGIEKKLILQIENTHLTTSADENTIKSFQENLTQLAEQNRILLEENEILKEQKGEVKAEQFNITRAKFKETLQLIKSRLTGFNEAKRYERYPQDSNKRIYDKYFIEQMLTLTNNSINELLEQL